MSDARTMSDVFWFYPNQIGFLRVVLAFASFYFMPTCPFTTGACYILSQLLDAVDGHAARHFGQCSKFGAILDQLTDRCTFLGLLMCLAVFYPSYSLFFQSVAVIDVACHWIHLHASLLQGKSSHKAENLNPILAVYYDSKLVLFTLCASNEVFFLTLYFLNFFDLKFLLAMSILTGPLALVKIIISLVQGYEGAKNIAKIDVWEIMEKSRNK